MAERSLSAPALPPAEARIPAEKRAGETALELTAPAAAAQRAGGLLRRALAALKSPKTLIPLALITALWIALPLLGSKGGFPVKLLGWLSFARGGRGRALPGALGGVLGRGVTAAFWISLAWGGAGQTVKGAAALFRDRGAKHTLPALLLGAAAGAVLGWPVFAGVKTAFGGASAMAGLAGSLLSLEALGRQNGGLYRLAAALTAGKRDGVRSPRPGSAESLLAGLALGFALAAAVPAAL